MLKNGLQIYNIRFTYSIHIVITFLNYIYPYWTIHSSMILIVACQNRPELLVRVYCYRKIVLCWAKVWIDMGYTLCIEHIFMHK